MTKEQKIQFYKHKYFIGIEANGKTQLLHFNKRGYELRNNISKNVVIFSENNYEHTKRFNTLGQGPFSNCYKISVNEHLFKVTDKKQNWLKRIVNTIIKKLRCLYYGRNL